MAELSRLWAAMIETVIRLVGVLGWPDVGLLLGLSALLVHRKPIADLLRRRGFHFGVGNTSVSVSPLDSQAGERADAPIEAERGQPAAPLSPMAAEVREQFEAVVRAGGEVTRERLLEAGAFMLLSWRFERVYNLIFGSQVNALLHLSTIAPATPSPLATIRSVYHASHVAAVASTGTPLDWLQWLEFLVRWRLIVVDDGERAMITPFGAGFLQYIADQGLAAKGF